MIRMSWPAPPRTVSLGPVGAEEARCRWCGAPTGRVAWCWWRLPALYCSRACCEAADAAERRT